MRVPVANLAPGDTYEHHRTGVRVAVLRGPEPHVDLFGRDCQRVWARRADTDAEGWLTYGLGAEIEMS